MSDEAPLVDSHFHVYTTDMPLAATAWHTPPEDATIERLIATLDAHGVTFGVLAAASLYGDYNDYMLEALRRHRRLRATAIVRPTIDRYALEALDREGFVGIRFQFRRVADIPDLASSDYRMLLRRVADLGWHVHLNDEGDRLPASIAAIEAAGVKLVIDHFGHPEAAQGVDGAGFRATLAAIERGRTWVKISAGYRLKPTSAGTTYAQALLKVAGGERLLWGSDWPFAGFESAVRYADTIAALEEWVPDVKVRRQIAGETPLKLYFARM
ncbi:MAG: amidohydrolase family protein [Alphaproteobacteria bacterium]|nr:amidohydrolase family protein [Alphaproteobacteria bacterium]